MPFTAEWKDKGYYVNFTGIVTTEEVTEVSNAMESDPRFDDLRYFIANYLEIDGLEFDVDNIAQVISQHAKINAAASLSNPFIKRAVVTTDETIMAFANLYIAESKTEKSAWQLKVFSTMAEAEQWVQVK